MTIARANKREREMDKQAHLYEKMAASLRAQSIESRIKRASEGLGG